MLSQSRSLEFLIVQSISYSKLYSTFWAWLDYNDCEQNNPQLDYYRRCPPALDKYALFLPQKITAVVICLSGDIQ